MFDEENNIQFQTPFFMYLVGQSNQGKTYFIDNGLIPVALKNKYDIHWVVNDRFPIEPILLDHCLKNKNYFIHPASNLEEDTLNNLIEILKKNENKKLVLFDNFTYQLSLELLNFMTYFRKYNSSCVFIGHTLFSSNKISPRLRECCNYMVFFYLPISNSYKKILGNEMFEIYKNNIQSKSYKFLIIDLPNSTYSIGKLPEYKIDIIIKDDQFKGIKPKIKLISKYLENENENENDLLPLNNNIINNNNNNNDNNNHFLDEKAKKIKNRRKLKNRK